MAIYTPRAFAVADRAALHALIDRHPFATLVTPASPEPWITHLPLLRETEDALLGHVARANPHARHFAGVASTAIFHGPHAYVSPTWYAEPAKAVPTWNFATVHVHGRIETLDDAAEAERVVGALVAQFEGSDAAAWRFALEGRERAAMLAAIVPFRLRIERIEGKFKLSQNRPAHDRSSVIAALEADESSADARASAGWMREFADPDRG
jgi:transcriptional regulator